MRIKHLLDLGLLRVRINVPHLELAAQRADEQVVLVDLVEVGRALLVFDLVLNRLASSLDVHVNNQHLHIVEA